MSVKAIPASAMVFAAGLATVSVSDVARFRGTLEAPKALAIVGGTAMVKVELPRLPVPPFVDPTNPVVFTKVPLTEPVTFRATVQEPPGAILAPVRVAVPASAGAVAVPPQVLARPLGVATTRPAGKASVKATPASAMVLAAGFVMAIVIIATAFGEITAGANPFAITGGATTTCGFPVRGALLALKFASPE